MGWGIHLDSFQVTSICISRVYPLFDSSNTLQWQYVQMLCCIPNRNFFLGHPVVYYYIGSIQLIVYFDLESASKMYHSNHSRGLEVIYTLWKWQVWFATSYYHRSIASLHRWIFFRFFPDHCITMIHFTCIKSIFWRFGGPLWIFLTPIPFLDPKFMVLWWSDFWELLIWDDFYSLFCQKIASKTKAHITSY